MKKLELRMRSFSLTRSLRLICQCVSFLFNFVNPVHVAAIYIVYSPMSFYVVIIREKLTPKRIQSWSSSFVNLLMDHAGTQLFLDFLEKEFSSENLRYVVSRSYSKHSRVRT